MAIATLPDLGYRWLSDRDLHTVLWIDLMSHELAWDEDDLRERLRRKNTIGMVAEDDGVVVGYYVVELSLEQVKLIRFGVHPQHRRRGVGRGMLRKLETRIAEGKRDRIVVEAPESYLDGHLFLKAAGYRAVLVLRGAAEDSGEDVYVFVKRRQDLKPG